MEQPSPATEQTVSRRLTLRRKLAWTVATVLLSLIVLLPLAELIARLTGDRPLFELYSPYRDCHRAERPAENGCFDDDAAVGWLPRPGARVEDPSPPRTEVFSVDPDGFRCNGPDELQPREPVRVIAAGDSFTWGSEVEDQDSWPAHLERRLSVPVANAGVEQFGFDQTTIRIEQLLERTQPAYVIASLIPDDVRRCGQCVRQDPKPYFDVVDGQLQRENDPVPPPEVVYRTLNVSRLEWYTSYSRLVARVRDRRDPGWSCNFIDAHGDYERVAALLVDRLLLLSNVHHFRLILVLQPQWQLVAHGISPGDQAQRDWTKPLVQRARELPIKFLDLMTEYDDLLARDPTITKDRYFKIYHMNPAGNAWVAGRIAEAVEELERGSPVLGSKK